MKRVFLLAWIATGCLLSIYWVHASNIYKSEWSCSSEILSNEESQILMQNIKSNSLDEKLIVNDFNNEWEAKFSINFSNYWSDLIIYIKAEELKITNYNYDTQLLHYIKYLNWKQYLWIVNIMNLPLYVSDISDYWKLYDITDIINKNKFWESNYMSSFNDNEFTFFSYKDNTPMDLKCSFYNPYSEENKDKFYWFTKEIYSKLYDTWKISLDKFQNLTNKASSEIYEYWSHPESVYREAISYEKTNLNISNINVNNVVTSNIFYNKYKEKLWNKLNNIEVSKLNSIQVNLNTMKTKAAIWTKKYSQIEALMLLIAENIVKRDELDVESLFR